MQESNFGFTFLQLAPIFLQLLNTEKEIGAVEIENYKDHIVLSVRENSDRLSQRANCTLP